LVKWVTRKKQKHVDLDSENDDWDLNKPQLSWRIWCLVESHGWEKLPFAGGLLDQPDWLLEDLSTISWRKQVIEDMMQPAATTPAGAIRGD